MEILADRNLLLEWCIWEGEIMCRIRLWRLGILCFILGVVLSCRVEAGEFVKIGKKRVAVMDIQMTIDVPNKKNSGVLNVYYTFSLDKRDLDIANKGLERYLNGSSNYNRMAAVILLYVNEEFAKHKCTGRNKCLKKIRVGVDTFFDFLNAHPELKQRYLASATSLALFSGRYKSRGDFMRFIARDAGYAFYGISYMNHTGMVIWTLLEKMIYSIRHDGYNGRL